MCDDNAFNDLLRSPEWAIDPYPLYRRLQEDCPGHLTPFGVRLISRYEDTARMLRDRRLERAPLSSGLSARLGPGTPLERVFAAGINFQDGERHRRLRRMFTGPFRRSSVAALHEVIRRDVARLLAATAPGEPFDVVATLAKPLPLAVICALLGVPRDEVDRLGVLAASISAAVEAAPTDEARQRGQEAMAEIVDTIARLVARRERQPRDDLTSAVVQASGEVSRDEIVANLVLLFGAGHETTQTLITVAAWLLAERPDLAPVIASSADARRAFLREALRLEAPTQVVGRYAVAEVEAEGYRIAPGERLALLVGAAHRDPAAFEQPDEVRLDRPRADLAFGAGPHVCLGADLALAEADIVVQALLALEGGLRCVAPPRWRPTLVMRVPEQAMLVYG